MTEIIEGNLSIPQHAAAVIQLLEEYASDMMGGGNALPRYTKDSLVAELRRRDAAYVILAFSDGDPVGLVICIEGFSTFACRPLLNIHDVMVSVNHRGKGLCSAMMKKVEALATRLGCCKLTLEVLEGNSIAQVAYRAHGFEGYRLDPAMGQAMFWEKKLL